VAEPGGAPAQLFFLRLAISVQLTLAVSGKEHASADIWFGPIRELAQDVGVRHAIELGQFQVQRVDFVRAQVANEK
jgi:hypothetical protein